MTTMCIQCAMRAILNDEAPPVFDETPEQHQRRVHPDLAATQAERREILGQLAEKQIRSKPNDPESVSAHRVGVSGDDQLP